MSFYKHMNKLISLIQLLLFNDVANVTTKSYPTKVQNLIVSVQRLQEEVQKLESEYQAEFNNFLNCWCFIENKVDGRHMHRHYTYVRMFGSDNPEWVQWQLWKFHPVKDGYYYIENTCIGECIYRHGNDVKMLGLEYQNLEISQSLNLEESKLWKFEPAENGYYYIESKTDGSKIHRYNEDEIKMLSSGDPKWKEGQLWKLKRRDKRDSLVNSNINKIYNVLKVKKDELKQKQTELSDISSVLIHSNPKPMNPELFLEQKNIVPLLDVLNRWAQQVNVASDRQDVLRNADLHEAFFSKLNFNTNSQAFANALVAEFKKYSFSARRADYHPLVNLLQHLKTDDLSDQDFTLFNRLIEQGQENLKALAARHAVGRIESPKGTGIGTGVLIPNNLLLTCNHIFSKSQVKQAWVRFNYYKPDSFMLDDYLFELDPNFVSHQNRPDYALLKVKGAPQQLTATPIEAILNDRQEIRLIHHPLGKPVEISGLGEIIQVGEDYIDHNLKTDEGSSGAPIFNRQWELVAIHQGHPGIGRSVTSGTMGGIPIHSIWNQIS